MGDKNVDPLFVGIKTSYMKHHNKKLQSRAENTTCASWRTVLFHLWWKPQHHSPGLRAPPHPSSRQRLPQQLLLAVSHVHCLTGQHSLLLIICQFSIWNKNHNATETLKLNELARRFFRNYPPPWNCCLTLSNIYFKGENTLQVRGLRFLDF